jgi:hypothetical protein
MKREKTEFLFSLRPGRIGGFGQRWLSTNDGDVDSHDDFKPIHKAAREILSVNEMIEKVPCCYQNQIPPLNSRLKVLTIVCYLHFMLRS